MAPVPTSTISILDVDTLWSIFMLNADMYATANPRPLKTARHTSQVCRMWRGVMLHSPTIWANVLDLRDLQGTVNLWRIEVMKRTGNAPLSIRGQITGVTMLRIMRDWLDDNWERIRILDVWSLDRDLLDRSQWESLTKPATSLESFRMDPCPRYLENKAALLFNNQAPFLKEFNCPNLHFEAQTSSWVSHLRSVTLSKPVNITQVLEILPIIPCLESLTLEDLGSNRHFPIPSAIKVVLLPQLINLVMGKGVGRAEEIFFLLQSIIPAVNCSLTVFTLHSPDAPTQDGSYSIFRDVISRYAHNSFATRTVQSLGLTAWKGAFMLDARHNTEIFHDTRIQSSSFHVTVQSYGAHYTAVMSTVLQPFFSSNVSKITAFDFILDNDLFLPGSDISDTMEQIIRFFHMVTRLRVSEASLRLLLQMPTGAEIGFPLLSELRLANKTDIHEIMKTISEFMHYRTAVGASMIKILDITEYAQRRRNWGFLDVFAGLKVVWNIDEITSEYVCGSGNPNKLDLTNIF